MKRTPGRCRKLYGSVSMPPKMVELVPVVALAERGEERRRLAGRDRHGDRVVGAQQVDGLARGAELALEFLGVSARWSAFFHGWTPDGHRRTRRPRCRSVAIGAHLWIE